jgi:hypothetical protein
VAASRFPQPVLTGPPVQRVGPAAVSSSASRRSSKRRSASS